MTAEMWQTLGQYWWLIAISIAIIILSTAGDSVLSAILNFIDRIRKPRCVVNKEK